MVYLHADDRLNAREKPTHHEREMIDAVEGILAVTDPPGIIRDEAIWYLGTALRDENNLEITMSLTWDRELALRILLTEGSFTIGWGGDLGEASIVETFVAQGASIEQMVAAFECELSRDIRVSRRRLFFGGTAELHIRSAGKWIDLLRGGVPSDPKRLSAKLRAVTLLAA
ncbi:hypothetical protein LUX12_20260 [Streptomyces somaliensis]|uniref:hypothetical protein n=1 Tax=Streptomyces somaliensis TaxID=78355 RepID=UPI0020CD1554|nr:hypothetical protein [Streptomyces somaliensis]MCP9946587.1 hypothetical protein [Streptomyces somaliensis]MCP9960278.1 hypothetical protein [Streptomyces somaliensis]MCP9973044.1 hypothetical protein [Streptomyces somaliensis]